MMAGMGVLDGLRFWAQVTDDARRTVVCSPDMESRVKGWVETRGLGGVFTVKASPVCPDDRVLLLDEEAIDAAFRESVQHRRHLGRLRR